MSNLVKVLESYRGKDRIIRLFTYAFMYLGGNGNTLLQAKFRKLAAELGACRVVLRLFDDYTMLEHNLKSSFGLKEPNPLLRPIEVIANVLYQLYYPVEHIAWLRDKGVLPGNSGTFWLLGTIIWAGSLAAEVVKCLTSLRINKHKAQQLKKQKYLEKTEDRENNSQQEQQIEEHLEKLRRERHDLILNIIQSAADLTNAISWLPKGFLWSQKLQPSANGVFGVVATLIMLYRNWTSSS